MDQWINLWINLMWSRADLSTGSSGFPVAAALSLNFLHDGLDVCSRARLD